MLKPTAALFAAALMAAPATAGDKLSPEEFCQTVSIVTEGVMEARQFGASLTETLDRVAKNPLSRGNRSFRLRG
jgi:hypothetical protein